MVYNSSSSFLTNFSSSSASGYLGITLAILGWGVSGNLIAFGLVYLSPIPFLALRFLLASIIISPIIIVTKMKTVLALLKSPIIWLLSLFETTGLLFQYFGQETIPAGLATLLELQFIVLVPIFATKLLNEKYTLNHFFATLSALIGIILITSQGNLINLFSHIDIGIIFMILSALSYSLYVVLSSKATKEVSNTVDSISMFFVNILLIAIFTSFFTLFLPPTGTINNNVWIWVFALVVFSTIIAFIGYFKSLKYISATTVSLLLLLQLFIPIIIDTLLVGIKYSYWDVFGGIFVIIALLIVSWNPSWTNNIQLKINRLLKFRTKNQPFHESETVIELL